MTLEEVFGMKPIPCSATPRRVEPMGGWPVPHELTPARIAQLEGMVARNKARAQERGETNRAARLTDAQVLKIRELRAAGERPTVIAKRFEIDRTLVWKIVARKNWTHI